MLIRPRAQISVGMVSGAALVLVAVYLQRFGSGCGTVVGLITALSAHRIVYTRYPTAPLEANLSRIWLLDGVINLAVFLLVAAALLLLLRKLRPLYLSIVLFAWAVIHASLLLFLFAASDCP